MQDQTIYQAASVDELAGFIQDEFNEGAFKKIFLVCGKHFSDEELKEIFGNISLERFSGFSSNPKKEEVSEGLAQFKSAGCDLLVGLGGGSAMDVAKAIKWFCSQEGISEDSLPELWAIPTTAGTGSESTPFAVCYEDGIKKSYDAPYLCPDVAYLCGSLILSVPAYHRNSAFVDALCQALESWWSVSATPESIELSKEAVEELLMYASDYVQPQNKCLQNRPRAGLDDEAKLVAAQHTLYGANLAGRAIALTRTTAPHAMSYGLTSLLGIAHGHAVGLCWSQVVDAHWEAVQAENGDAKLKEVLEEITKLFDIDTPQDLSLIMQSVLFYLGLNVPKLNEEQIQTLAAKVDPQRLSNNPVAFDSDKIATMYEALTHENFDNSQTTEDTDEDKKPAILASTGKWVLGHKRNWVEVKEIQDLSMSILKDVDKCCRDLGIDYFLCEGAMLGAVRHHGPIPWDDDIDLGLLRPEYDRFVKEAPAYFGDKYSVDTLETNPKHWTISGKVQMNEPCKFMRLKTEGLSLSNGPFVDLFPFDKTPKKTGWRFIWRGRRISAYRSLLFCRSGFQFKRPKRKASLKLFLSSLTSMKYLFRRIDSLSRRYNNKDCKYVTNFASMYKCEKETFPAELFSSMKDVPYGTMKISVPQGAEGVLETIYGDWQAMPPYRKREGKHGFILRENYKDEMLKFMSGGKLRASRYGKRAVERAGLTRKEVAAVAKENKLKADEV